MMKSRTARRNAINQKSLELRSKLFPQVKNADLWHRKKSQGFTTIPRTMPLFMNIMDSMSTGKPVSSTYFSLWCKAFDDYLVTLNNKEELACHSGFTGQRAVQTFTSRLDILKALGFIDMTGGPHGERSYVLLLNPYLVIEKQYKKKGTMVPENYYNALIARASDIGADDI